MKICWKKLIEIYLITFGVIMLIYNSLNLSPPKENGMITACLLRQS